MDLMLKTRSIRLAPIRLIRCCGMLLLSAFSVPGTSAGEIRTYQFIPDGSLPYSASCGECSASYLGARSDVAGTFTVDIDLAAGKGTLLSLDDKLVNYFLERDFGSGLVLQPTTLPTDYARIIPPWANVFHAPFAGEIHSDGTTMELSSDSFYADPGQTRPG